MIARLYSRVHFLESLGNTVGHRGLAIGTRDADHRHLVRWLSVIPVGRAPQASRHVRHDDANRPAAGEALISSAGEALISSAGEALISPAGEAAHLGRRLGLIHHRNRAGGDRVIDEVSTIEVDATACEEHVARLYFATVEAKRLNREIRPLRHWHVSTQ